MEAGDLALFIQICAIAVIVIAAVNDFRTFRIPNSIPLTVMALFAGYMFFAPEGVSLISHLASLALVFTLALVVFRYRIMAGGDVKLISAIAVWFSVGQVHILLAAIALAGGLQALVIVLAHYTLRALAQLQAVARGGSELVAAPPVSNLTRRRVPYGIAIAGGSIAAFILTSL